MIIPRGAENTIAIDLIAQNLRYQLSKIFTHGEIIQMKPDNEFCFSHNEIIDPKYQFFNEKIIVNEETNEITVLCQIFSDFIQGKKLAYHSMFLEFMINSLITLFSKSKYASKLSNFYLIHDLKKIDKEEINLCKNIIIFKKSILSDDDFIEIE